MIQVLSVTPECYPLIKTGGLADVAGALPGALAPHGVAMTTLLPAYPAVLAACPGATPVAELTVLGAAGRLLAATLPGGAALLLLDLPELYARPGNPYTGPDGRDWPDNARRFAALAKAAAELGLGRIRGHGPGRSGGRSGAGLGGRDGWRPAVVHGHDWPAGLAPAYLALAAPNPAARPGTVHTIHNLAFQGQHPAGLLAALGLPPAAYTPAGVEYHQSIGFLKAGLAYADKLTTVSPSYAREIATPGGGMGMDGLLRARAADLAGIVNGLDTAVWDPAADPHLPAAYAAADPAGKAACKVALEARLGLAPGPGPLCVVVSRLSEQKGLDLVLAVLPSLLAAGGRLAVLGAGDAGLEAGLAAAAAAHPGQVAVRLGYDEPLAHLLQAGGDAILVPSRFEPCGLTQLIGLRYGTLPVVARVGGLADTVVDANPAALADGVATGFQFAPVTAAALADALARLLELWAQPAAWAQMRARAMTREVGWAASAAAYARLYEGLAAGRAVRPSSDRLGL